VFFSSKIWWHIVFKQNHPALLECTRRTEHKLPRPHIDIQVLGGPQPQDRNISPHICFLTVIPRRAVPHTPPTQASRCHFTTFRETSFIQKQAGLFIITNTPFSIMPIDYHFSYARFAAATVPLPCPIHFLDQSPQTNLPSSWKLSRTRSPRDHWPTRSSPAGP